MIADERMVAFINSFDKGNTPFLENLEREALAARVPVIRRETQGLIRFLLAAHRPMKILEVGTAIGFSALLMSEYGPEGCHITTIEKCEKRLAQAAENFARAGRQQQIMGWQNSGPWPQPSGQSGVAPQPQSQPAGGMGAAPQPQPDWGPGPRQAPAANSSADMA